MVAHTLHCNPHLPLRGTPYCRTRSTRAHTVALPTTLTTALRDGLSSSPQSGTWESCLCGSLNPTVVSDWSWLWASHTTPAKGISPHKLFRWSLLLIFYLGPPRQASGLPQVEGIMWNLSSRWQQQQSSPLDRHVQHTPFTPSEEGENRKTSKRETAGRSQKNKMSLQSKELCKWTGRYTNKNWQSIQCVLSLRNDTCTKVERTECIIVYQPRTGCCQAQHVWQWGGECVWRLENRGTVV